MAGLLIARNAYPVWIMPELPIDVVALDADATTALLTLDVGDLVDLTGLPKLTESAPTTAALWVEGWTERLAWGVHEIALVVSGYCRTVPPPTWDDPPPDLTWDDLAAPVYGVGGLTPAPATWDDMACRAAPRHRPVDRPPRVATLGDHRPGRHLGHPHPRRKREIPCLTRPPPAGRTRWGLTG